LVFLTAFSFTSWADIIHLKNGRSIEGLIKNQDRERIELDVGFGTVKFDWTAIEKIEKSSLKEEKLLRKSWQEYKVKQEKKDKERQRREEEIKRQKELEPKLVDLAQDSDHIIVNALLNNRVHALLVLDTGASTVLLSKEISQRLDTQGKEHKAEVQMADGRKKQARYIVLDSVKVEGAEAKNVGAVVLSDREEQGDYDGLLGMSFLKNFNFTIDSKNNKLILQKQ